MQLLFDFFPVIAFFLAFQLTHNIFVATAVIIGAVVLQVGIQLVRRQKISKMSLVSGALVLVFGGLTLIIHDQSFIQWKVTVVEWLFAIAFLASRFFGERTLVERLMGESLQLERHHWRQLNWAWIGFFLALGAINLYVAYSFSLGTWVNFKFYGVMGLTLLFVLAQGAWLMTKLPQESPPGNSTEGDSSK
jgi:intracellular septation protein